MALPLFTILEYLFKAGPVLKAASDIVKKNKKETNQQINKVEINLEHKVELLEKKVNEQVRINNELTRHLEDTSEALLRLKRAFTYILYVMGIAVIASIASLTIAILK
jgi:hypothetical protein